MEDLLRQALEAIAAGRTVALSTIVAGSGSLPMSRRSKMLVLPDGTLKGTVGGGCLEAEVYACARKALQGDGSPAINRFVLTESQAGVEGLNCGGTVEIFTEVLGPGPVVEVLEACVAVLEGRVDAALATALSRPGNGAAGKLLIRSAGERVGSLGEGTLDEAVARTAAGLMGADRTRVEEIPGGGRVFLETLPVTPVVILFGGGHVSREVARVAATAGFRVTVTDDRPAYVSPDRHPDAHETRVISFDDPLAGLEVDEHTGLVVVTRGHQHDEKVLRHVLQAPSGYLGMIGSGRKVALMREKLAAEGFPREALDRLHAPIGLEIGADNPGEIAVSIVAEMIAVRRRGAHPGSMKLSSRAD